MPTPLELILDPVSIAVFVIFASLMLWETLVPARKLPSIFGWRAKGIAAFLLFFFVSSYLPLWWGETLGQYHLVNLTVLGKWGGALAGLLIYEAGAWAYHRSLHASKWLWRSVHQMHHSAERLDVAGAFWFSPLDMIGWTALASFCLTLIVGIAPDAAVLVLYATTFLGVFQHSNIRTPQWLGYIIQRPESHSAHHERGVHARNYSDLPLFDILFGTFYNPKDFSSNTGFYDGASSRVGDMLLWRDVSMPRDATNLGISSTASAEVQANA